eukprot:2378-Heterococcus_DN1.PRE.2
MEKRSESEQLGDSQDTSLNINIQSLLGIYTQASVSIKRTAASSASATVGQVALQVDLAAIGREVAVAVAVIGLALCMSSAFVSVCGIENSRNRRGVIVGVNTNSNRTKTLDEQQLSIGHA